MKRIERGGNVEKKQYGIHKRPRYTRYELAKLVRDKREELGLNTAEIALQYEIEEAKVIGIEEVSRAFNVQMYQFISSFLGITRQEILAKDEDEIEKIKRSIQNQNKTIQEAVRDANFIFNEMVMQEKIGIE